MEDLFAYIFGIYRKFGYKNLDLFKTVQFSQRCNIGLVTKGQIISKAIFVFLTSPKNERKNENF